MLLKIYSLRISCKNFVLNDTMNFAKRIYHPEFKRLAVDGECVQ